MKNEYAPVRGGVLIVAALVIFSIAYYDYMPPSAVADITPSIGVSAAPSCPPAEPLLPGNRETADDIAANRFQACLYATCPAANWFAGQVEAADADLDLGIITRSSDMLALRPDLDLPTLVERTCDQVTALKDSIDR
jgi:hypothetical protein